MGNISSSSSIGGMRLQDIEREQLRESFADEGSWIQYNVNLAELQSGRPLSRGRADRRHWKEKAAAMRARDPRYYADWQKAYYYAHHAECLERARVYRAAHRDHYLAYNRQYRLDHLERALVRDREYAAKHAEERARKQSARYHAAHPEAKTGAQLVRESGPRRRNRLAAQRGKSLDGSRSIAWCQPFDLSPGVEARHRGGPAAGAQRWAKASIVV